MTKYAVMNDETLVDLCLLGESGAFEELVTRHERAVMNTAKKVTGSRFSAEDASQDAFVSAWMRLDSLRDRSKFRPWVCAIAKNCAMALLTRYRSVVPDISLHLVENEEMGDNPDPELSALLSSETDEELHALVDALSEKLRETIRLHYFEGYSVAEIADLLSVPGQFVDGVHAVVAADVEKPLHVQFFQDGKQLFIYFSVLFRVRKLIAAAAKERGRRAL